MGNRAKQQRLAVDLANGRRIDPDQATRTARQARRDGLGQDVDTIADQLTEQGFGHVADRIR